MNIFCFINYSNTCLKKKKKTSFTKCLLSIDFFSESQKHNPRWKLTF